MRIFYTDEIKQQWRGQELAAAPERAEKQPDNRATEQGQGDNVRG